MTENLPELQRDEKGKILHALSGTQNVPFPDFRANI
jgi:hypothetical protein